MFFGGRNKFLKVEIKALSNLISNLTKEIRENTNFQESKKCNICGKLFRTKPGFEKHMSSHDLIPQLDGETAEKDEETEISDDVSISHNDIPEFDGEVKEPEDDSNIAVKDMINKVTLIPDCQADWSDQVVHDLIVKKVFDAGLKPLSLVVVRSEKSRAFTSCEVNIEAIPLSKSKELYFPFNGIWTWKFG